MHKRNNLPKSRITSMNYENWRGDDRTCHGCDGSIEEALGCMHSQEGDVRSCGRSNVFAILDSVNGSIGRLLQTMKMKNEEIERLKAEKATQAEEFEAEKAALLKRAEEAETSLVFLKKDFSEAL